MNLFTFSRSFRPGEDSTPDATSTANGPNRTNHFRHVIRIEPARQNEPIAQAHPDQLRGNPRTGPAALARYVGIDQNEIRREGCRFPPTVAVAQPQRLDDRNRPPAARRGVLVAVELDHVDRHRLDQPFDFAAFGVHEDTHQGHDTVELGRDLPGALLPT